MKKQTLSIVLTLVAFSARLVLPDAVRAQSTGNNVVYDLHGKEAASIAFIDANAIATANHKDLCGAINYIFTQTPYPALGSIIDARGMSGTALNCNASPWAGIASAPAATILLPAGTITISATWILPSNTRLVGEGDGTPTSGFAPGTTIRASGNFSPMIQFGSSSVNCCSGISVENLTLDGAGGNSINGIVNQYSQDFSYVDHVTLYQIRGIGLLVEGTATNSGPYSHIVFDTGNYSGTTGTVCAQILSVGGSTRGIHGLTCISETNDSPAAVLLDSSNNSISDVTIQGFHDGILVGAGAPGLRAVFAS